jgi:hypothetical protein
MVGIRIKKYVSNSRKEDSKQVQSILFDKGFYATLEQCIELWEMYSENNYASGWVDLGGYTTEEIFNSIKPFFEPLSDPYDIEKKFYLQE